MTTLLARLEALDPRSMSARHLQNEIVHMKKNRTYFLKRYAERPQLLFPSLGGNGRARTLVLNGKSQSSQIFKSTRR
jgi:hypothetical protein